MYKAYGLDPHQMTDLRGLRVDKLLRGGRFDGQRAALLAYRRHHGRPLHPRDPWGGLTLAHYRSIILDDLTGGYGAGGMVLARMKERFKQLEWTRPHDMAVVFPPLA